MKEAILLRLLSLITLRVNMRSNKFSETVQFAAEAELGAAGIPHSLAKPVAAILANSVITRLEAEREALRTVAGAISPTPSCDCAGCRVIQWANEEGKKKPPTEADLATQAAVREAIFRAQHGGGEGGEKN